MTSGESTDGSCTDDYLGWQIFGALSLALALCLIYGVTSFWAAEQKDKADTRQCAAVWDLLATSFSYAIGWAFFNALTMCMGCLPGNMGYYVSGLPCRLPLPGSWGLVPPHRESLSIATCVDPEVA